MSTVESTASASGVSTSEVARASGQGSAVVMRAAAPSGLPREWIIFLSCLALAHVPLLVLQAQNLWSKPHYQFFPIAVAGACWCARRLWPGLDACVPGSPWLSWPLFGIAFGLLFLAAAVGSPWLGSVATLATLTALTWRMGGFALFRQMLPVGLVLLLLVPPPLDLDQRAISLLQSFASYSTSMVLDYIGILHIRSGNVIEIVGHRLFVEEACSGIHSFFSVAVYTGLYLIVAGASWLRSIYLFLWALMWVLLANLVRIVSLAVACSRWDIDLTTGWRHETLGLVLFMFVLGGLWCMDQFWLYCSTPIAVAASTPTPRPSRRRRRGAAKDVVTAEASATVSSPVSAESDESTAPSEPVSSEEPMENGEAAAEPQPLPAAADSLAQGAAEEEASATPEPEPPSAEEPAELGEPTRKPPRRHRRSAPTVSRPLEWAYGCLAVLQFALLPLAMSQTQHERSRIHDVLDAYAADTLPAEWQGWKRDKFEAIERSTGNFYGEFTRQWTYTNGTLHATVAVDYPFAGWHELPLCYRSAGWSDQEAVAAESPQGKFFTVRLTKPLEQYGFLWFSIVDARGQSVERAKPAPDTLVKKAGRRVENLLNLVQLRKDTVVDRPENQIPGFQVQLLVESYRPLTDTELMQAQQWFTHANELLRAPFSQE